jgi:hypothetical protein
MITAYSVITFIINSRIIFGENRTECGQYGLENDQHILRNVSDIEGKTFWIGEKVYHVTLPWMEMLGRYLDTDLSCSLI